MTSPEIRKDALLRMRGQTPQEPHEGPSEFIRAFLVAVLLVAAGYALTVAVAAYRMGAA